MRRADAGEADHAVGRDMRQQRRDDGGRAGAFDHDVGRKLAPAHRVARVIGARRARATSSGFGPVAVAVVDMHVAAALHADQRGEQADRAGAGDEQRGAAAHLRAATARSTWSHALATTLVGSSSTRVEAERGIDLDGELRRDAPALGAEAVQSLDAVLGVEPVAAHVPLAGRAGRAGDRIGMAHDADHVIAGREAAILAAPRARGRATRGRGSDARDRPAPRRSRPR